MALQESYTIFSSYSDGYWQSRRTGGATPSSSFKHLLMPQQRAGAELRFSAPKTAQQANPTSSSPTRRKGGEGDGQAGVLQGPSTLKATGHWPLATGHGDGNHLPGCLAVSPPGPQEMSRALGDLSPSPLPQMTVSSLPCPSWDILISHGVLLNTLRASWAQKSSGTQILEPGQCPHSGK